MVAVPRVQSMATKEHAQPASDGQLKLETLVQTEVGTLFWNSPSRSWWKGQQRVHDWQGPSPSRS